TAEPFESPQPNDLLTALASKFTWHTHAERAQVSSQIERLQRNPEHLIEILERSEPFLALLHEKLEAQQLPPELAFLPYIESGYEPSAMSHVGAAGLWQFMPSTANHLGMHTSWWYDERLDINVSTEKALEYLSYLNKRFEGNWELTLASYNGGEGHVASRIRRADGMADFWSIQLKAETSNYVPKLLAIVEVISAPEKYGFELPEFPLENRLTSVALNDQIDLRLAAKEIGMDYADLRNINSGFLRWISPPGQERYLLIPTDKESRLIAALDVITSDEQLAWNHYKVSEGDTLIEIAREFGITLRSLVAVNQLEGSRIYINQDLLIPAVSLGDAEISNQPNSIKQLYIVKSGDSLWDISRDQSVSISQIRRLNGITNNHLKLGQVLILSEVYTGNEFTYLVKNGDSLSQIADRFRVGVAEIQAWNSLRGDLIRPGQELTIRTNSNS
ncbi:UNVERIFIED_CONTAM: hypothetical protein GTU68_035591, partial [Idotea baltica]|nr:hypothetical protein [Idotea baltica]